MSNTLRTRNASRLLLLTAPISLTRAQGLPADIGTIGSLDGPAYPLKVSSNNRYLVDQNGAPFLIVGDSPQNIITNLSQHEADVHGESSKLWHQRALDECALHLHRAKLRQR